MKTKSFGIETAQREEEDELEKRISKSSSHPV